MFYCNTNKVLAILKELTVDNAADTYLEAGTRRSGEEELAMILPALSTRRERVGSRRMWF